VDEVLRLTWPFPDAGIWIDAVLARVIDERDEEAPFVVGRRVATPMPAPAQIDQLPVRIKLQLSLRVVANPDRPRPVVPVKVSELLLADAALAAHPVHHLEVLRVSSGRAHHERPERSSLPFAPELGECA